MMLPINRMVFLNMMSILVHYYWTLVTMLPCKVIMSLVVATLRGMIIVKSWSRLWPNDRWLMFQDRLIVIFNSG